MWSQKDLSCPDLSSQMICSNVVTSNLGALGANFESLGVAQLIEHKPCLLKFTASNPSGYWIYSFKGGLAWFLTKLDYPS